MSTQYDLILKNANIVDHLHHGVADIGINSGKIIDIGTISPTQGKVFNCKGLTIIPGIIDSQVHFREPGMEHKEDLKSGSRAAIAGGVTTFFEMPNTNPATTDLISFQNKLNLSQGKLLCNYAFFIGATPDNIEQLSTIEKLEGCPGVKIFMGSSTGSLLIDKADTLEKILASISNRCSIHAESEALLKSRSPLALNNTPSTHPIWRNEEVALSATKLVVELARKINKKVHILHVTTKQEMDYLFLHKNTASVEVTPQHLTLSAPEAYNKLGTFAQMNPPIRNKEAQQALWQHLKNGTVDVIGSDHAPHTKEEKQQPYPHSPSGMPGVQTLLPIMLNHVHNQKLSLQHLIKLTSFNPAKLFCIKGKGKIKPGFDADLAIIDLKKQEVINKNWLEYKCGWSPFEGVKVTGWPVGTIVNGFPIMWDNQIDNSAAPGKVVKFDR